MYSINIWGSLVFVSVNKYGLQVSLILPELFHECFKYHRFVRRKKCKQGRCDEIAVFLHTFTIAANFVIPLGYPDPEIRNSSITNPGIEKHVRDCKP